jgi:hypothetical protein
MYHTSSNQVTFTYLIISNTLGRILSFLPSLKTHYATDAIQQPRYRKNDGGGASGVALLQQQALPSPHPFPLEPWSPTLPSNTPVPVPFVIDNTEEI